MDVSSGIVIVVVIVREHVPQSCRLCRGRSTTAHAASPAGYRDGVLRGTLGDRGKRETEPLSSSCRSHEMRLRTTRLRRRERKCVLAVAEQPQRGAAG